ncbi:MAG: hypothetical protein NVSMB14_01350 [Isosphaeraceae bacterium]
MSQMIASKEIGRRDSGYDWVWAWGLGFAAIFAAEVAVLTSHFEASSTLVTMEGWLPAVLKTLLGLDRIAIAALGATAILAVLVGGIEWEVLLEHGRPRKGTIGWAALHFAAYAGMWASAFPLFQGDAATGPWPNAWLSALFVSTTAWIVGAAFALSSPSSWFQAARQGWRVLLGGLVVGIAASEVGQWSSHFWKPLSRSTLWSVRGLLSLCYSRLDCQPDQVIIGSPKFSLIIAPGCSGVEGIGLILTFLGAFLWIRRGRLRFPQALCLIPLGVCSMWITNVLRITGLIILGGEYSPTIALGGFHSQAGWLALNAVALSLVAMSSRWTFIAAEQDVETDAAIPARENPALAYLVPLLAIVGSGMLTGAFSAGFDRFYPIRVAVAIVALWWFRRDYNAIKPLLAWSWTGFGVGVIVFVLWLALVARPGEDPVGNALAAMSRGWAAAWIFARIVGFVVTVPLAEELAFRGFLTRRLIAADFDKVPLHRFTWLSFILSSLAFGFLHSNWLAGTLAGMLYALVLYRRGRLGDVVLAHAVTNGLLAIVAVAQGQWFLL